VAIAAQPLSESLNAKVETAARAEKVRNVASLYEKSDDGAWLEVLTTSAIYPLISHNPRAPLGTGVLFRKTRLDDKSELYFGMTTSSVADMLVWPSVCVNGEKIPIMMLQSDGCTFADDVVIFAFVTRHVCHTIPLGGPGATIGNKGCHLAGYSNSNANARNALFTSRSANSAPKGRPIRKNYHRDFDIEIRQEFTPFARDPKKDSCRRGGQCKRELLLHSVPVDNAMLGSPVVSADGRLIGIVKCGLIKDRAVAIDIRSAAGEIVDVITRGFGQN